MHEPTRPATTNAYAAESSPAPPPVALLTGADDRPYALGLASALLAQGVAVDFIGSNQVHADELAGHSMLRFLNLRGDQSASAAPWAKVLRLARYYVRLMAYAVTAQPKIFHILWNNKVEWFDRTLLMGWYRLSGRRVVLTAHNVNKARRDNRDNAFNRATLRVQYRLADHVFVHTEKMRSELVRDFGVADERASLVPFGLYDALPSRGISRTEARGRLGLGEHEKVMLFFGQIAPYKGLPLLAQALPLLAARDPAVRLVIAGKLKQGEESHWSTIEAMLARPECRDRVSVYRHYIDDDQVETFFRAADLLVMPYNEIFQSGVLFVGYRYGLPVVACDVGSLREDILEGRTGFVCTPRDPDALAEALVHFFDSELYRGRDATRDAIRAWAFERHSWSRMAALTVPVYRQALPRG